MPPYSSGNGSPNRPIFPMPATISYGNSPRSYRSAMTGSTDSRANSSTVRRSSSCSSSSAKLIMKVSLLRQGLDYAGRAGAAEPAGHPAAGGDEGVEVDARLDAEAVQHPHEVLGGEVAGG